MDELFSLWVTARYERLSERFENITHDASRYVR